MRIERIRLRNFKCYGEVDVSVDRGVTVIHGPNGSGKSSLLEACFFALYGAKALEGNLEDVVRNGAEDAEVEVWFTHAGGDYHVERRIRLSGDRAQTATCVLDADGATVEGARDVRGAIVELLRMDAEAFVNCAYVRQGEVNKLINAKPRERQAMLDDLLQLGTLEEYRERARDGRLAVNGVREIWADRLEQKDGEIEELEEQDLHGRLNELESRLGGVDEKIENFEDNRERARETMAEATSVLDEHEEKQEELAAVTERIEEVRDLIAETEAERESIADDIGAKREALAELDERVDALLEETDVDEADAEAVDSRLESLSARREAVQESIRERSVEVSEHESEVERREERAEERTERAAEKRETAEQLDDEADRLDDRAEETDERIESIEEAVEGKRAAFEDVPVEPADVDDHLASLREELDAAREREAELREELAPVQARIEDAEALLAEGKCPECGQPVDGSPHVDAVDEHREEKRELEEQIEAVEAEREAAAEAVEDAEALQATAAEVEELEAEAGRLEERHEELVEQAEAARAEAEEAREAAAELEAEAEEAHEEAGEARERAQEAREAVGELNGEQGELRERIEAVEALADAVDERAAVEDEVERLGEKRSDLADRNDERRETLSTARKRKQRLEAAYDEERVEAARGDKERAEDYLERVDEELEALGERRDDLVGAIDTTEDRLDRLEELRTERESLAVRVDALGSLHEEAETLEGLYGDLRAELRQRNIASLERLLNDTFDLVYANDAYARIELDPNYALTVYQKDGEALDPEQLSGGERALFNLALRTAIYRLLAEGIEGAAPMPPLILDEPTVFLDSGHVSRLVDLVESMRDLGVEQIVVVSHDDELVGAADDLLTVEKDPTTNRSSVARDHSLVSALDASAD